MSSLTKRGDGNLRICYRPSRSSEFYGVNTDAILRALTLPSKPRTFLFHGPSGTGKTSAARFMALIINCDNTDGKDPCLQCESCKAILAGDQQLVRELNMADKTGIDDSRAELKRFISKPFRKGKKKVLILDEAQQLSNAAQQVWLKTFEEPPEWGYIILCTTDPQKFINTVTNRLTPFQFHLLDKTDGVAFILDIARNESLDVDAALATEIYDTVGGSHRELITALEKVKLEGIKVLSTMGIADNVQRTKLNDFIKGTKEASIPAVINMYYDLLNQFDGQQESFRRALGNYAEKALRSEALKDKTSNQKKLGQMVHLMSLASHQVQTSWEFIPKLITACVNIRS